MRTAIVQYAASSKEDAMSTEETPVRNPDDGQEQVDPMVTDYHSDCIYQSPRSGHDPVDYGPRGGGQDYVDLPRSSGADHFDPLGSGGGYNDIF
jgi:hypothetical protein